MINRLEGYTGTGFNERRAYIGSNNGMNFINDKKKLEKRTINQNNCKTTFSKFNNIQLNRGNELINLNNKNQLDHNISEIKNDIMIKNIKNNLLKKDIDG